MVAGFVSTPRLRKKQTKVRMSDFSPANIWLQILQRNGREIAGKQGEKTLRAGLQERRAAGMDKPCQCKRPYSSGRNDLPSCRGGLG